MGPDTGAGEGRVGGDDVELHLAEDEAQRRVGQQRARQEPGLAQDLEAVADAQHQPAGGGELGDLLHHRGKARDRAHAQVVAVGEAAGDDDGVDALQVAVAVPEDDRVADPAAGHERIDLVAGPGEADDAELHGAVDPVPAPLAAPAGPPSASTIS